MNGCQNTFHVFIQNDQKAAEGIYSVYSFLFNLASSGSFTELYLHLGYLCGTLVFSSNVVRYYPTTGQQKVVYRLKQFTLFTLLLACSIMVPTYYNYVVLILYYVLQLQIPTVILHKLKSNNLNKQDNSSRPASIGSLPMLVPTYLLIFILWHGEVQNNKGYGTNLF